ncbi:MAG TPA: IPT/TIG domain-containing protein [Bryobacteraceae bacterium]|nr:IPT/TIG domain-containing protein [Bryobacteraceae bacterium]
MALGALLFLAPARGPALTGGQWQSDLQSMVSFLERTHPSLFFHVSSQDFNAAVNALNQDIPQMTDAQVTVAMMKLAAMVGDAHTAVTSPFAPLPIRFRWFSDGLFVNAAAPEYSRAIGVKAIRIGNLPVDQAYNAISAAVSHENDYWVREMSETYLATAEILSSLGVTSGPAPVPFVFQDMSGAQFTLQIAPSSENLLWPPDSTTGFVPLWRSNGSVYYWFQFLPTTQTMYVAYNQCEQMSGLSFASFWSQVLAAIAAQPIHQLVVDLRNNTGGDSSIINPLLNSLSANAALRRQTAAIIGQATMSSGMMNAAQLSGLGIPLVGQPTGGDPNAYGNIATFNLPNSGLRVTCSTRYYTVISGYTKDSVLPDVPVSYSSADYFARYDPFLAAALTLPARFSNPQPGTGYPVIVNGASFGMLISPGEWATAFGDFAGVTTAVAESVPYGTSLSGVQVQVNGTPAPLLAVTPSQINFQVPSATAAGTAQVAISLAGQKVVTGTAMVVSSSPGIFLADFLSADRPGAVLTQGNQLTNSKVRAPRNSVIQIFATGAEGLTQTPADGTPAPLSPPFAQTTLKPRVFVGNEEATVEFSGLAPGYVGLWQINARVPDVPSVTGQIPVVMVAPGGYASNAVTIWVE